MHPLADQRARDYLSVLDRVAPDRTTALYVVGSAALDEFRPDRSDVDLVVVLDRRRADDCRLIRDVHRRSALRTFPAALLRLRPTAPAVCDAVFVCDDDLTTPVRSIEAIGSHVGLSHACGEGFDVNPVVWKTLRDHGVPVRGPRPSELGLDVEEHALTQWNLDNLHRYWEPLCRSLTEGRPPARYLMRPRWATSWVTLGTTRLHHTIATGGIVTKEQAGAHALDTFDDRWHPIIRAGLAARTGERRTQAFARRRSTLREAGEFGLHVIADADRRS